MTSQILVVTATLGDRPTLQKTISSVRSIGGNNVKHIIIAPKEKILAIQDCYNGITCIPEPEGKKGIYPVLNYVFYTYGHEYEYLTFINDDDYWLPEYKTLITAILKGDLDLVYGKTKYVDAHGVTLGEQASSGRFSDFIPLLTSNIILLTQQATIIRSDWYFKLNGFDESYKLVADTKFWAILSLENVKYRYFNCCCAVYTIQDGQLSSDHETQSIEHKRMLNEFSTISQHKVILAKIKFRMANVCLYFKRFLVRRRFLNPFMGGGKIVKLFTCLMPWKLKRWMLIHLYGYEIDKTAYIGLSYIFPKHLIMKAGAKIGHLNVAIHLDKVMIGHNSSIACENWITGFPTKTMSLHFSHDTDRRSELIIGDESAITKNHHIDCTNAIYVGNYVTIAGYRSQLLTHSIDVHRGRQDSHPITIGDYCFVSTACKILGGAILPPRSVLATGAVLNKQYKEELTLYGGIPARPIKKFNEDDRYFLRESGYVY